MRIGHVGVGDSVESARSVGTMFEKLSMVGQKAGGKWILHVMVIVGHRLGHTVGIIGALLWQDWS